MSAVLHEIRAQARDIGFPVRRLLPSAKAQSVGPFVFLDHMGPARFEAGSTVSDVRPHPHIGLATVTYLFSGAMMHRDGLGSVQRIEPGAVNLMTAGRGIVHSERIPSDVRDEGAAVEGIQMWVALPLAEEGCEPAFCHYSEEVLPRWRDGGADVHLLIGEMLGRRSPVAVKSETLYAALSLDAGGSFTVPAAAPERALYVAEGDITLDGVQVAPQTLLVLVPGATPVLQANSAARLMLLGGAPLDGDDKGGGRRLMWWNFVASRRELIEDAKADWQAGRFVPVPGETEFIPLPER
ncbi:pirin family protein [Crenobacter cavernae]|uniref:Pirin family protein n=1 Tax=Crenobacter cavernae TaxID=2290923 RepID=A0A345Y7P2_9NEIS|nr:pirin family protein [Crenobacter cavernae]AXK39944.1 pirin family protein [Crenobacter cavernae]